MGAPVLSIIIPVFNAEQYIGKCLESILGSSLKDLEVICVDDGSTDYSLQLLKYYENKDERVKVLTQNNLHAGVARNAGLRIARGKYIHFIDADDWIDICAYEKWIAIAEKEQCEVCVCMYNYVDLHTGEIVPKNTSKKKDLYSYSTSFREDPTYLINNTVVPWNKIYLREFLTNNNIYFDNLICANDRSFYYTVIHKANRIFTIQEYWIYHRINNEKSLVGETRLKNFDVHFQSFQIIWKIMEAENDDIKKLILRASILDCINFYKKSIGTKYEDEIVNKIYDFWHKEYIPMLGKDIFDMNWYGDYVALLLKKRKKNNLFIFVKSSVSDLAKAFSFIKCFLFPSCDFTKIVILLDDNSTSSEGELMQFLPKECTPFINNILFIRNASSFSLKNNVELVQDNIVFTFDVNVVYPKNWGRYLLTAYLNYENVFEIAKYSSLQDICEETLFSGFSIVESISSHEIRVAKSKKIIVSLTSYPARINMVGKVIETMFVQSVLPDKVILWLARSQFPSTFADLPEELLALVKRKKLDIQWCDDLKPHKKYFYAFKKYTDALIITIDDDALYHKRFIENLYCSYLLYPKAVSAGRAHLVPFMPGGEILPYKAWPKEVDAYLLQPSMQLCATGVGGILYPTVLFTNVMDLLDEEIIKRTCLYADDLWLKAIELVAEVPVVVVEEYNGISYVEGSQEFALWHNNLNFGGNDRQLRLIMEEIDKRYGFNTFVHKLSNPVAGKNLIGIEVLCDLLSHNKLKTNIDISNLKRENRKQKNALQTKLDESTKQKNTLQTKLDESMKQKNTLQAKLDESTKQKNTLQAKLDESTKQKNTLQAKLDESTKQKNALQTKLDESVKQKNALQTNVEKTTKSMSALKNSYSFKIGRAITYVPRKIRGGIRCYQDHGITYTIKRTIEHLGIDMGTGDLKK